MSWPAPGKPPELAPRAGRDRTRCASIAMPDPDHAEFEAMVGKGTYIRALARDLAAALGTLAHVVALRRLAVGPFHLKRGDFPGKTGRAWA